MQPKIILIVGGAGYVGSHVNKLLCQKGFHTVIFDNLSRGKKEAVFSGEFVQGDLGNLNELNNLFSKYRFDAILHFAALTDVGESILQPAKYYRENVVNSLNLLNCAIAHNVKNFIFSSSAAIFGMPQTAKIAEDHPRLPINPYGQTKFMVESILADYDKAYGLKSCCLRYFNACGSDPEGEIPSFAHIQKNLIPLIFQSIAKGKELTIYGTDYPTSDGTCIRDYIHVSDLAEAHLLGLEKIWHEHQSTAYNLGNERGYSVKEVITIVEKITKKQVKVAYGERRQGDPAVLLANADKAHRELGWKPRYMQLESMIQHSWKAMNPTGDPP